MKFKIPIPDFSNSEVVEKRTNVNKKKVKSTQEDVFIELISMISNVGIKPGTAIMWVVYGLIMFWLFGSITSSLNTDIIGNSAVSMIGIVTLLISISMVLGLVSVLGPILGVRGGLF